MNYSFEKFFKKNFKFYIFISTLNISIIFFFLFFSYNFVNFTDIELERRSTNFISNHFMFYINFFGESPFNFFTFLVDRFNIAFFLLFCVIFPFIMIMLITDTNDNLKVQLYMFIIFILSFFALMAENIFLFYFLYETILILVFLIMYLSASSRGGIEAAIYFAGWAILGSILVGIGVISLTMLTNTSYFFYLKRTNLTPNETYWIYMLFFLGFGIKLSIWPFWYWLPKAHVEVSTGTSIFLSCILIKLSLFCLLRVQHVLMAETPFTICIFFTLICTIDIVFRFLNLRDLKAIIAYSSILHTNLLILLIHLDSLNVLKYSMFYIWAHSLSTLALFLSVNIIEETYNTRNITCITGVWYTCPYSSYLILISISPFLDLPISLFYWGELWLWVVTLENTFFIAMQVLAFVNIFFVSFFFKVWWNVCFGLTPTEKKKFNSSKANVIKAIIIIFINIIQLIIGIQPSLLISIYKIFLI